MEERNYSLAVFIDYENLALGTGPRDPRMGMRRGPLPQMDLILERLVEKGRINVKRAYCDWQRFSTAVTPLHELGIELIEIPDRQRTGKNSADIRLTVDAMETCFTKNHLDTFVICSGDSDFSPLVAKLKEHGKRVIGVGMRDATSALLAANCDEFIFYEDIALGAQIPEFKGIVPPEKELAYRLLFNTIDALMRDNIERPQASLIKDTIRRKRPDFSESNFGYRNFTELLKEAAHLGFIIMTLDNKSGTWCVNGFSANPPEPSRSKMLALRSVAHRVNEKTAQRSTLRSERRSRRSASSSIQTDELENSSPAQGGLGQGGSKGAAEASDRAYQEQPAATQSQEQGAFSAELQDRDDRKKTEGSSQLVEPDAACQKNAEVYGVQDAEFEDSSVQKVLDAFERMAEEESKHNLIKKESQTTRRRTSRKKTQEGDASTDKLKDEVQASALEVELRPEDEDEKAEKAEKPAVKPARRKSRKKAQVSEELEANQDEGAAEKVPQDVATAQQDESAEAPTQEQAEAAPKKRRPGRPRKNPVQPSASDQEAEPQEQKSGSAASTDDAQVQASQEASSPAAKKGTAKTSRTRRSKKSEETAEGTTLEEASTTSVVATKEVGTQEVESKESVAAAPKKRTTRRKKNESAEAEVLVEQDGVAGQEAQAEEQPKQGTALTQAHLEEQAVAVEQATAFDQSAEGAEPQKKSLQKNAKAQAARKTRAGRGRTSRKTSIEADA